MVRVGHRTDAPPFSFAGADGAATGYTVELCQRIIGAIGEAVGGEVTAEFVPLTTEERFQAVADGRVDMHCGAATATLERREQVSFSVPVFITGISALMSADAPRFLRDVLAGEASQAPPRLAVVQAFEHRTFGVRAGTTAETGSSTRWPGSRPTPRSSRSRIMRPGSRAWPRASSTPTSPTGRC